MTAAELQQRFERHFVKPRKPLKKCWPWQSAQNEKGYGLFRLPHRVVKAHRLSFALWHVTPNATLAAVEALMDELPDMHHACENHTCVNPRHLEPKHKKDHNSLHATLRARSHRYNGRTYRQS